MTRPRRAYSSSRPSPSHLIRSAQVTIGAYASGSHGSVRDVASIVPEQLRTGQLRKELVRTGVAALAIAALGLAAAGAMTATSSASNVPDQAVTSTSSSPDLGRRVQGTSRDADREKATSAQQRRTTELSQARTKVTKAQRDAAIDERAKELTGASADTTKAARQLELNQAQEVADRTKKVMPLTSYRIAAQFGAVGAWASYHTGVDFSAPLGTPIHAVAAGVVTHAGSGGGAGGWAGSYVVVLHDDGYSTLYAHMNPALGVAVAQKVGPGDLLGHVGLTGRTFGAHCHVELYPPGATPGDVYTAINLMPWLNAA